MTTLTNRDEVTQFGAKTVSECADGRLLLGHYDANSNISLVYSRAEAEQLARDLCARLNLFVASEKP